MACNYNRWTDPEFMRQLEPIRGEFIHSGWEDTEWNTPECIDPDTFADPCGQQQVFNDTLPQHQMMDFDDCFDPYAPNAQPPPSTPPYYPGIADTEYPCTPRRYEDVARLTPEAGTPCATPPGMYNMGGFMMPLSGPAALQPDPMQMRNLLQAQLGGPGSGRDRAKAERDHYVNYFKKKAAHEDNCVRAGQRADGLMAVRVQQVIEQAIEESNLQAHVRKSPSSANDDECASSSSSTAVEEVMERLIESVQANLENAIAPEEPEECQPQDVCAPSCPHLCPPELPEDECQEPQQEVCPDPCADPCPPPCPEPIPPPCPEPCPPPEECVIPQMPGSYFSGLAPSAPYSPPRSAPLGDFCEAVEKALNDAMTSAKLEKHVKKKKSPEKDGCKKGPSAQMCIRTPDTTPSWSTSTSSDEVIIRLQRKLQSNLQGVLRKYGLPSTQRRSDMEDMEAVGYLIEEEGYGYKSKPHPSSWKYAPRGDLYPPGVPISDDEFEDDCPPPRPPACDDAGDWPVYDPAAYNFPPDVLRAPPQCRSPPMEGCAPPRTEYDPDVAFRLSPELSFAPPMCPSPPRGGDSFPSRRPLHVSPAHKMRGAASFQPMACGAETFTKGLRPGLRQGPMKPMGLPSGRVPQGNRRHSLATSTPLTSRQPAAYVSPPTPCRTLIPQSSRRSTLHALPAHRLPGAPKHQPMASATNTFAGGLRSGLSRGPTTLGPRKTQPGPTLPSPCRQRPTGSTAASSRLSQLPAHKMPGAANFQSTASAMGGYSRGLREDMYSRSCAPKPLTRRKPPC